MKVNKKIVLLVMVLFGVVVLALASSYAIFTLNVTKNSNFKVAVGTLELSITDTTTQDKYILEDTVPTKDSVALEGEGYTFTVTNTGTIDSYYTVYLDDVLLADAGDRLDNSYVKVNLVNNKTGVNDTKMLSDLADRVLDFGYLHKGESISYTLRMWVDYNTGNEAQNKYFATQIRINSTQSNAIVYREPLLNGADPVLTDNLVPVVIADDGTVTKANLYNEWYSYEDKKWANAVVLKDNSINYGYKEVIPEGNIESYFVWIPKYSYQIWDLGDYSSLTTIGSKERAIQIKFGLTNTVDKKIGECTTPMNDAGTQGLAGESGNCKVGDYMTHPAFLAFGTNGLWIGKFETGYDGATSTSSAGDDVSDSSKIIIKPNSYSWRSVSLGNMFKASFDYLRNEDSHMMKNTEWGVVAYLSHSIYGTCGDNLCTEVRINNNTSYVTGYAAKVQPILGSVNSSTDGNQYGTVSAGKDGTYAVNYSNNLSNVASTTGNRSGIYDMSGGIFELVMGFNTNAITVDGESGLTTLYNDFFNDTNYTKYWDGYALSTVVLFNNRILGDATGEIGPFGSELDPDESVNTKSSWYKDLSTFISNDSPWFHRGRSSGAGTGAGVFAFSCTSGGGASYMGFRVVLAPTK